MKILGMKQIGSWGDCIMLTPAINALITEGEQVTVQMHPDAQCRAVSRVFDNLAQVEFRDDPIQRLYISNKDRTHTTQRALNELGLGHYSCIPKVKLTNDEIDWAKNFLKNFQNPIILINDNSGSWDQTNIRASYVRPPVDLIQFVANYLNSKGYDILQFGRKEDERFTPLENVFHIRGLDIRQLFACYHEIGKIVSGDTGDYHAMISVGGRAVVFHPPENTRLGYEFWDLHYLPELWKKEPIYVKYIDYTQFNGNIKEIEEILKFLNEVRWRLDVVGNIFENLELLNE